MSATSDLLDRLLEPVGRALSPAAARELLALRADSDAQARMDELADRSNEGMLNSDERADYEALVMAATVIALLQSKARSALANPAA
jgi:hypothetical protein